MREGNLLYLYEKVAWISTDIGMANDSVRNELFNYLVYEDGDTIKVCLLNKEIECVCEIAFFGETMESQDVIWGTRALAEKEEKLFFIKNEIISNIVKGNYGVGSYEYFNLNFVLLPMDDGYKLYILTGTSKHNVIPFGNDYIFFTDKNGNITDWRKMHSVLLALNTNTGDGTVCETIHSHRLEEPFITPTDICTFMLYGPLYGQKTFTVLSTALQKTIHTF